MMMPNDLSAFAVLGPTACGKTALALRLAEHFPCEIISLDSALIYRDMDIGTAKPTPAEREAVPHHLIDIVSPVGQYSAADFVADCTRLVAEISARGRLPLIVGGTMMYYHALTQGLNSLPQADEAVRRELQEIKQREGLAALYRRLQEADPITAARLSANDSQRIERALEVFLLTGKPLSSHFNTPQKTPLPFRLHTVALIPEPRSRLHAAIDKRFEQMLANGFLDEVGSLKTRYPQLDLSFPAMRCIGYRQARAHLNGETDYQTFVAQGRAATRQLAKRQLTWLRKLPADTVVNPYADDVFEQVMAELVKFFQAA